MRVPDVVGYKLGEAKRLIEENGMRISFIKVTSPPKYRSDKYNDDYRIIRVENLEVDEIGLLVCSPLAY